MQRLTYKEYAHKYGLSRNTILHGNLDMTTDRGVKLIEDSSKNKLRIKKLRQPLVQEVKELYWSSGETRTFKDIADQLGLTVAIVDCIIHGYIN